jgi:hypothetical protein
MVGADREGVDSQAREYLMGMYHCTVDLLLDWFGISSITTKIFLQNSQTGGRQYSDSSPFSIPW